MRFFSAINLYTTLLWPGKISASSVTSSRIMKLRIQRVWYSASSDPGMVEFVDYLDNLKNYEKIGVPTNAGIDADDGFDLRRMRRLLDLLGNPQSKYKVVHIAGTKGKGSTAAFLSNILRAEGYTVGCYTSPHIRTIRERMSVGRYGEPVSSSELLKLFHKIKIILDQAVVLEQGQLSYFEVLTSIAFTLFAHLNVDIAVIEAGLGGARDATNIISSSELTASIITTIGEEHLAALGGSLESIALAKSGIIKYKCPVILGGPFLPYIEQIIRDKASSTCSPVVSASDVGNRISVRDIRRLQGKPFQACDIVIQTEKDIFLSLELLDVNLMMLGSHQLLNATTATCTALCLRDQGWKIADQSIRRGLEGTQLLGRSQFLTFEETTKLGVPGTTVLLDGAHTKESAQALVSTIHKVSPQARLVLVVAMASDKDHTSFAREFLKGQPIEAVFLIEVGIAEDSYRTTPAPILKECWVKVSIEQGLDVIHDGMADYHKEMRNPSINDDTMSHKMMIEVQQSLKNSLRIGSQILERRNMYLSDMIVVTGSLHIVSAVLSSIYD